MNAKKYILKPGLHQFAPGSAAVHCNEDLSDLEAEWYLQKYPHIQALFQQIPATVRPESREDSATYFGQDSIQMHKILTPVFGGEDSL